MTLGFPSLTRDIGKEDVLVTDRERNERLSFYSLEPLFIYSFTRYNRLFSKVLSTLPGISDAGMSGILPLRYSY